MISTPEQAMQQISELLRKQDNPSDKGMIVATANALLDTIEHLERVLVLNGGNAQKGCVTIKIPLHAFKDAMGEIKTKITHKIAVQLPSQYTAHSGEFYVNDGVLSTSPFAKTQEKLFTPAVIEGGNSKPVAAPEAKKATI